MAALAPWPPWPVAAARPARIDPQRQWLLDADASGLIDGDDRRLILAGIGSTRGLGLEPLPGYDFRADLTADGTVGATDLRTFDRHAGPPGSSRPAPPRPVVLAWHYGWYDDVRRRGEPVTAAYLGGPYLSRDAATEERFNALKHEFGISVDMLSWVDDRRILANYALGYFSAPSFPTRRFGWLYESVINLGADGRLDFSAGGEVRRRFLVHFRRMARMMTDPLRGRLRRNVFRLDGRPVIYLFGSHLYGASFGGLAAVADALEAAREAFAEVAGVPPFLIGDEALFSSDLRLSLDRAFRASFFDAITRYHHYDRGLMARLGGGAPVAMGGEYLQAVLGIDRRTMEAYASYRNRFTGAPLLVIPSSAAGFAKAGLPTLLASGQQYAELLEAMLSLTEEHLTAVHAGRLGTRALPAAVVVVGSWNEEFEGHALFPAAFNLALEAPALGGFDWLFALKSVYGWNHYRDRSLA